MVNILEMGKNTCPLVGKLTLGSLTVRISYSTDAASPRRAIAKGARAKTSGHWDLLKTAETWTGNTSFLRGSVGRRAGTPLLSSPTFCTGNSFLLIVMTGPGVSQKERKVLAQDLIPRLLLP